MRILLIFALAITMSIGCKSNKETVQDSNTQVEKRSADRGNRKGPPSIDEVFKMDANNDGLLSKAEAAGPIAKNFDKIDANKDGFITKEEFQNAPKPQKGNRQRKN